MSENWRSSRLFKRCKRNMKSWQCSEKRIMPSIETQRMRCANCWPFGRTWSGFWTIQWNKEMTLHRKSRSDNGILRRHVFFEIASFRRKTRSRRTKECEKQGFGGNATNKQMHKRVPMCPACAQVVRLARTTTRWWKVKIRLCQKYSILRAEWAISSLLWGKLHGWKTV